MALFGRSGGVYLLSAGRVVPELGRQLLGGGSDAGTTMRIWKQAVVSLVLLSAAAVVWARYFPGAAELLERAGIATVAVEPARAERTVGEPRAAPVVLGAPVREARINDSVSAIGDGRAARSVSVTPYVAGRVVAIEVGAGDYVRAGAPLVRLDAEGEEIEVDRARLTLADAEATLARDRKLVESQAVSETQLRASQLARDQAELALRDAELALERRAIRAPFDGWVGILGVEVGDQVTSETEVATLDDRSQILVDFRVPERFVGQVKVGAPASARPLARPELELEGEVVAVDSRIDADTRTLRVRASLDNAEDALRAGMAFSITMRFPGDVFAAVDPLAIQWNAGGAYVWVEDGGVAKQAPVRIVQRNNDAVLVDADLAPGRVVVTQGMLMLRAGAPFRFEGAAPAAAGGGAPRPAPT
jgi:RND family efflux transporter MFP subunit